jgi:hypothetical protein
VCSSDLHTYLCAGIPWVGRTAQAFFDKLSKHRRRWSLAIASNSRDLDLEGGEAAASQSHPT